ncbi:MAG: sigma 54-interacting transcriptional regulator [Desulfobacterales bacterium]|nr:sigma 54-interacting transcriptional regulator [Desulfobacterales bacterium]
MSLNIRGFNPTALNSYIAEEMIHSPDDIHKIISLLFEHSYDGFCVVRNDGQMIVINKAAAGYLDLPVESVLNNNVKQVLKAGHYDHSTALEVIRKKRKLTRIYKTRKGRNILTTSIPIFDASGGVLYVVQNERDITQIKKLEQRLKRERSIKKKLEQEIRQLTGRFPEKGGIVSISKKMKTVLNFIRRCAEMDLDALLVQGETGVGKGLLTNYYHTISKCSQKPFIQINCAALPENLIEAELFGYEKGAFTGAGNKPKPGLFELAEGGILFLDEIGELPLYSQAKLLHCLEERRISRIGGTRSRKVNCRVIAATNQNLKRMCEQKKFRPDLYYRLNTANITIPPLRERAEDIAPLARHFLDRFNSKYGLNKKIAAQTYLALGKYGFPGNVRELSNIINNAIIMSDDAQFLDTMILDHICTPVVSAPPAEGMPGTQSTRRPLKKQLEEYERMLLLQAVNEHSTAIKAAGVLGISKTSIMRKLKKYGLLKKDLKTRRRS